MLLSGGTSGIGRATVVRLCAEGARVVFTGRSRARGATVARETGARFVRADATVPRDVERSVARAVRELGGLDALVLNAGVIESARLSETSDAVWDAIMETNLIAPFRYAVACLPELRRAGGGSITVVASDAGVWPDVRIGAYSVSKRALIMLAQMLAIEAGPAGIRVNAVCPGMTAPGMTARVSGRSARRDLSQWPRPPLGRLGAAEDVAAAVAFFVSSDAAFCNGSVLLVDGGMRAASRASEVHAR